MRYVLYICAILIALPGASHSQGSDELILLEKRLNIIANFADRMCKEIPLSGEGTNLNLNVDGNIALQGLVKELLDTGLAATGNYTQEEYIGLFRKDLIDALGKEFGCRQSILDRFESHFQKESTNTQKSPKTAGQPCQKVSGSSDECISGYCLPGPHISVGGSETNYCTSQAKNCAIPGGDGAMYGNTIRHGGTVLTCENPNKFGYSGKWAQFFLIR